MAEARRAFASDNEAEITVLEGGIRDMKTYADALSIGRGLTETPLEALNEEAFTLINSIDENEYQATLKLQRGARQQERTRGRGGR